MERRSCERYPVKLEAIIRYPALGLIHAQALNLGPDGLYIETGNILLAAGSCIELVLLGAGRLQPNYKFSATIMFTNDKGAGVLFSKELFSKQLFSSCFIKEKSRNNCEFQEIIQSLLLSEMTVDVAAEFEQYYELKKSGVA